MPRNVKVHAERLDTVDKEIVAALQADLANLRAQSFYANL